MNMHRLAIAILIGCSATAAAAEILVVRATGPSARSYPAGRSLADNAKITLQANDQLVVLDKRGTRTLRGPGTFTPGGPAAESSRASVLASSTPQRRARIGAVRSVGASPSPTAAPPSLWHVNVARTSTICLDNPADIMLWRSDATRPTQLTVSGGGSSRTLDWAAGQTALDWPNDLSIRNGSSYSLSWAGAAQPTTLTFKTISPVPPALDGMASALIRNGCTAQLDTLIETARVPEDRGSSGG